MASQEITRANVEGAIQQFGMFTTISGDSLDDRKRLFTAITNAEQISELLEKNKGQFNIEVVDIVVQPVEMTNEQTGEPETAPRVVFIDKSGKAYSATSKGLLTSVKNIMGILGEPSTWGGPIAFTVHEKRGRNGFRFLTLEIA